MGEQLLGPTLPMFGTPEQRARRFVDAGPGPGGGGVPMECTCRRAG